MRAGGRDGCVARGSQSRRGPTNEETNALRSKEHACSGTGEYCEEERGDKMDKGVELLKHEEERERERKRISDGRGKRRKGGDKVMEIYFALELNSLRTIKNYTNGYEF